MPINPIYPVVSDLLPLEKIPSELEAIRDGLEGLLGNLYFKDLIVGKSYYGDAAHYSLTIFTGNSIGINIPFVQDLKLAINSTGTGTTEFPISFSYRWEVLRYSSAFNFSSFDNSINGCTTNFPLCCI